MKSISAQWFICKIRYEKMMENGLAKKVTEQFVVDALSFSEAEARITEEMSGFISGDFTVEDLTKATFKEIFFSESDTDDRWYKAKVAFITIDEKTENEKRSNVDYLVQGASVSGAIRNIDEIMRGTLLDYSSVAVAETQIMDVFRYVKKESNDD